MSDGWKYLPEYGVSVRPDGVVMTRRKGIHFGSMSANRYLEVWTKAGPRRVHRLVARAFLGESNETVNHKNGIKEDNRLANLEYCPRDTNSQEAALRRNAVGCYQTKNGRWQARIQVGGRSYGLGTFATEEEARKAYREARENVRSECPVWRGR